MAEEEFYDPPPPTPPRGFEQFVRDNPKGTIIGALILGIILGRLGIF